MGLDQALDISVSAIHANRTHMEVISSNLANINTTRTVQGGPYKRKIPVFSEKPLEFAEALNAAESKLSGGIEVSEIVDDPTPFQKVLRSSGRTDTSSRIISTVKTTSALVMGVPSCH
jgi:flagellar basal-body rod protein FlgC